jgi:small subunit ribosomal protein S8
LTFKIATVLKQEGFIDLPNRTDTGLSKDFLIGLKYKTFKRKPYISNIIRVSTSGQRVYCKSKNIPMVLGGLGVAIC